MRRLIPFANPFAKADDGMRRKRPFSFWKAAALTATIAPWVVIGGLVAGGAWVVWSKGGPDSFPAQVKSEVLLASLRLGFEIDQVWVDGMKRSDQNEVLAAIGAVRGEPILEYDPEAARQRLIELPWVREARVALALPSQIHVGLTERDPVALWQLDRRLQVIDAEGAPIPGVDAAEYGRLPILVGEGANEAAAELFDLVAAAPAIAERMTAAVFVGARRWTLRLDDRIDVRLPAEDPAAALVRLTELEAEHGLLARDIVTVDLRLEDRLIVRLAPGVEPLSKSVGADGNG